MEGWCRVDLFARPLTPRGAPMKCTSLLAALLVVVGLVAGCGSSESSTASGDSGGSASVEEFCGAFLDLIEQARQQGTDISDADAVELA